MTRCGSGACSQRLAHRLLRRPPADSSAYTSDEPEAPNARESSAAANVPAIATHELQCHRTIYEQQLPASTGVRTASGRSLCHRYLQQISGWAVSAELQDCTKLFSTGVRIACGCSQGRTSAASSYCCVTFAIMFAIMSSSICSGLSTPFSDVVEGFTVRAVHRPPNFRAACAAMSVHFKTMIWTKHGQRQ